MFLQVRYSDVKEICLNAFSLQVSTFAINYRGHPFMESLTENRSLLYRFDLCFSLSGFSPQISLVLSLQIFLVLSFQIFLVLSFQSLLHSLAGAGGFVVMLALGWLPEFSDQFSIVDFSDEFRSILLQVRLFVTF